MFKVFVFVCALATPRDACDRATARDYTDFDADQLACAAPLSFQTVALEANGLRPLAGEYLKASCVRGAAQ